MTSPSVFAVALAGGAVVGVVAHELTHYIVARMLGIPATIGWLELETYFVASDERTEWRDVVAGSAPVLVGTTTFPLTLYALVGVGGSLGVAMFMAWLFYTVCLPVPGGASATDYRCVAALLRGRYNAAFDSGEELQGSDLPP